MDTHIAIGVSKTLDSLIAGREAAEAVSAQFRRETPNIMFVFISTIFDQSEVIKGVRSVIGKRIPLVGCSTTGSITSLGAFRNAVTVCAVSSENIKFSCSIRSGIDKNSRMAGNHVAKDAVDLLRYSRHQVFIMLPDALSGDKTAILRGAQEVLGTSFPIVGGAGIDEADFYTTYQFLNGNICIDSIVAILIGGNINIGIGTAHGWQPIGRPHQVTRTSSNLIREIDQKKAVELYKDYLGKTTEELISEDIVKIGCRYPLGMYIKEKKDFLLRVPMKIEDDGSLVLSAKFLERKYINLMISDKNLILEATRKACLDALKGTMKSKVKFAIVFSDIGRLLVLRKDFQKEAEMIKEILGPNVPFFGCYTCGEYIPVDVKISMQYAGETYFDHQAITVTVVTE